MAEALTRGRKGCSAAAWGMPGWKPKPTLCSLLHQQGERDQAIEKYHQLVDFSRELYGPTGGWTVKHTLPTHQLGLRIVVVVEIRDLWRGSTSYGSHKSLS